MATAPPPATSPLALTGPYGSSSISASSRGPTETKWCGANTADATPATLLGFLPYEKESRDQIYPRIDNEAGNGNGS